MMGQGIELWPYTDTATPGAQLVLILRMNIRNEERMKTLFQLNNEIAELNLSLRANTNMLRITDPEKRVAYQELMEARHHIILSIASRQASVIRVYEDALMSNVRVMNRKAA